MTYAAAVLADSPLAYWRRGDSAGTTAADSSGNSRTAAYYSSSSPVPGLLTSDADGARSVPQVIGNAAWMNVNGITVEAWIKPSSTNNNTGLVSRFNTDSDWIMWCNTSNKIAVRFYNTVHTAVDLAWSTTPTTGAIYHVVATYVSGQARLYVNGTQVDSSTALTGNLKVGIGANIEGGSYNGGSFQFAGVIDEIAVYSGELSPTRIGVHYNAGLGIFTDPPDDPTDLDVDEGVLNLGLSWDASTGSPDGYDVRIDGGTPIDAGNVLTYDFTGLDPSTSYDLEVRAYNAYGDSGWSLVTASTLDLLAPTGLAVLGDDEDTITLTWDTHPDAEGFEVRIDGGASTDVGLTTIHMFTGLDEDTLYTLEARAYLGAFFSDWSSLDSTTEGPPPTVAGFTATIKVGAHEWVITDADTIDPSDPLHVLDGLTLGWQINESDPWPTQPDPTDCTVGFYATDVAELDDVEIGTPMYVVLEDSDGNVFATFHGRVGQASAKPIKRRAGLRMLYTLPGVDYTVDLAESDVTIVDAWPAESADDRFGRIVTLAASVGVILTAPSDTGSAAFEALDPITTNLGALLADHLRQIAIVGDVGPERYIVVPVMDGDGLLDHFECVLLPRSVPASSMPGTFAIIGGLLTLVFADPDANGLVSAGDVDLDTQWTKLKYRAVNQVTVSSDTTTVRAVRPGPPVRLTLDSTLTDEDAMQRMATLYLPDHDEAVGWVAEAFRFYAHRQQSALVPSWFPDHREDPPNTDVFVQPIAVTGIPANINFGGVAAAYAGQLANVSLTMQRRKLLVDFSLRRQLSFGTGDDAASWEWAFDTFPTVAWEDIDPDLSWYEARLGKAT